MALTITSPSFPRLEESFERARILVLGDKTQTRGIGGLNEKVLHRILKLTLEPREEKHEIEYLGAVADIMNEDGITEIQTRGFDRLAGKLSKFLPEVPVRLVYPIPAVKYLRWMNTESGELTERRRVPKRSTVFDAYRELSRIRPYLAHENLTLTLVLLEVEEYRTLDGWDATGKRGSTRFERIPNRLIDLVDLHTNEDYLTLLLPEGLPDPFTVKEYAAAIKQKTRWAYQGIRILMEREILFHIGARGREFLYSKTKNKG